MSGSELNSHRVKQKGKDHATKKHPQQATSNVFTMFDQSQIQEFKEASNMIDQNRGGFIDKEDLHDMLASLRKNPMDSWCHDEGDSRAHKFHLMLFGEKLSGTDLGDVIRDAFACFDDEATGTMQKDYLRELLRTVRGRLTDKRRDELYTEAPMNKNRKLNDIEFTSILKHGTKDKDDWKNFS